MSGRVTPREWKHVVRPSTAKSPGLIIKDVSGSEDIGLKGGPVRPIEKSWRTRSGQRLTFGAPKGGWPQFGPDGKIVREVEDANVQGRETEVDGAQDGQRPA